MTEDELKSAFVQAFNRLLLDRERYIAEYGAQISELAEVSGLDEEIARLQIECAEAVAQAEALIAVNARSTQDQARYMTEHDALVARYDSAKDKLEAIAREKQERAVQREKIRQFIGILEHNSVPIDAFDEHLWNSSIETVTVRRSDEITVAFKSGTEIVVSAKAL